MHFSGFNFLLFNKYYRFLIITTLIFVIFYYKSVESALFQDPPKPLDVWMDPFSKISQPDERTFFWQRKNFGQWCRNFTMNM